MKKILGIFILCFGALSIYAQHQIKLSGFPGSSTLRIKVQATCGEKYIIARGDTTFTLKGYKNGLKVYIIKNNLYPLPASVKTGTGVIAFLYKSNGYLVYINGKLQSHYVQPTKTITRADVPDRVTSHRTEGTTTYGAPASGPRMGKSSHLSASDDKSKTFAPTKTKGPIYLPEAKPGMLTAGEINDFSKWNMWNDLNEGELNIYKKQWNLNLYKHFSVMVLNPSRIPIVNATVKLWYQKTLLWENRTDNTGKAELWVTAADSNLCQQEALWRIEVMSGDRKKTISKIKSSDKGTHKIILDEPCSKWNEVDIAFIVDATGSMGDEIQYLKTELTDVMGQCQSTMPGIRFRLGAVFYRDLGDEYLTRFSPLEADPKQTIDFIQKQRAGGGGDEPEGVDTALSVALNTLEWNPNAAARMAFLVLDAPPHRDPHTQQRITQLTQEAARKGIRLIPLTASGMGKTTEYLMRSMALATNGTYIFLTDDSGLGDSHLKPSTDHYKVELLNHLLIRVIRNYSWHPGCGEEIIAPTDSTIPDQDTMIITEPVDSFTQDPSYFRAFPNPTQGPITLETIGFNGFLYLTDMNGKILEQYEVREKQSVYLNLNQYPPGIYYFKYLMPKSSKDLKILLL